MEKVLSGNKKRGRGKGFKSKETKSKLGKLHNKASNYVCSNWESDSEMLPEGWRKRSFLNAKDVKVYQYLGLSHQLFQSTKEVFRFMRQSNTCSLDDALKFLSG